MKRYIVSVNRLYHKLQIAVDVLQLFGHELRCNHMLSGKLRGELEGENGCFFRFDFAIEHLHISNI